MHCSSIQFKMSPSEIPATTAAAAAPSASTAAAGNPDPLTNGTASAISVGRANNGHPNLPKAAAVAAAAAPPDSELATAAAVLALWPTGAALCGRAALPAAPEDDGGQKLPVAGAITAADITAAAAASAPTRAVGGPGLQS